MTTLYIESIGIRGPGMDGWRSAKEVLAGQSEFVPERLPRYKPQRLPPNERRRATELVRLAFAACEDAVADTHIPLDSLAAVFASSGGDYPIIDQICRALMQPERMVSPTQFHNSVHNSAAGYWSIATGAQALSTSLSVRDESAAGGLLETATMMQDLSAGVLLAIYDIEPPQPLREKRPIEHSFSTAFLLTPKATPSSIAKMTVALVDAVPECQCADRQLEALRKGNPAARTLPLLQMLAQGLSGTVHLPLSSTHSVRVTLA